MYDSACRNPENRAPHRFPSLFRLTLFPTELFVHLTTYAPQGHLLEARAVFGDILSEVKTVRLRQKGNSGLLGGRVRRLCWMMRGERPTLTAEPHGIPVPWDQRGHPAFPE